MQLFFAVTGAQGSLAVVLGTAPSLLVFSLVQASFFSRIFAPNERAVPAVFALSVGAMRETADAGGVSFLLISLVKNMSYFEKSGEEGNQHSEKLGGGG